MIKLLDCTLRDGGYVNNWEFGESNISEILNCLKRANIDYIETGFLKECIYNPDKTFFDNTERLEKFTDKNQKYTVMINCGEYDTEKIPQNTNSNLKIRLAFKKHNQEDALNYIQNLQNKGWDVFANPMSTNTYTKEELETLIKKINLINPYGLSIVDTLGNMYENDVLEIFKFIDERLSSQIPLGFHSHNSLQLSFSNTKALIKMGIRRDIIIDCCLFGIGRGAGNLCTELITKYLNDNCSTDYDIKPILKTISEIIQPIYNISPWGYSTPYYIAALHGCHPNYAHFLLKMGASDETIASIIEKIPQDKKTVFDKDFISSIL